MRLLGPFAATFLVVLLTALEASADTVAYTVEQISLPGYSASWIHPGENPTMGPDGNTYYMGGPIVYRLSGSIFGERDLGAGTVTFTGGTIFAETLHKPGTLLGVYDQEENLELSVTGGSLELIGSRPRGFLHTTWQQAGAPTLPVTFYFADIGFAGYVNGMTADLLSFTVWGNKTMNDHTHLTDLTHPVGIDLHVTGIVIAPQVPEPMAALLLAVFGARLVWRRKRLKCAL